MGRELQHFVRLVGEHAGYHEPRRLERAVQTTLRALGSHLDGVPSALQSVLPSCLHYWMYAGSRQCPRGPAAVYLAISNENRLRVTTALEIVLGVMRELSASLDPFSLQKLRELLPPAWAALIAEHCSSREDAEDREEIEQARSHRAQRRTVVLPGSRREPRRASAAPSPRVMDGVTRALVRPLGAWTYR